MAQPADQTAATGHGRQGESFAAVGDKIQQRLGVVSGGQTGGEGPVIAGQLAQLSQAMPGAPGERVPGQGAGEDFGEEELDVMRRRGVDVSDVERIPGGQTFFWRG